MNIRTFWHTHWHNLRTVWQEHPLETFWLAVFAMALLLIPRHVLLDKYALIFWLPFLPYLVLLYKLRIHKMAYYAAGLLPLAGTLLLYWFVYLYPSGGSPLDGALFEKLFCLNVLFLLALLFDWTLKPNRAFLSRAVLTLVNIASALLVSGCLMMALGLIDVSLHVLFESQVGIHSLLEGKIYYVSMFVLTPLLFLSFERPLHRPGGEPVLLQNRVIEISLNYIVWPMLVVFTLLIYVYTAKIVWEGELPDGGVAFIVCTYLAAGLGTQLLQELSCQRKWQRLHRLFGWLTPVPLVLLWIGIGERIGAYGLTVMRIWLLAVAILLTVYCVLSLRQHWRQYRLFSILLLGAGLLVGIILPLEKIAAANQQARFEHMLAELNLLDADGKIVQPLPPASLAQQEQWEKLSRQINYLPFSADEGKAHYGAGYAQLTGYAVQSDSEEISQAVNDNGFVTLGQSGYQLPAITDGAMELYPVRYVSPRYDDDNSEKVAYFEIKLRSNDMQVRMDPPHQHIQQVFAKHGLNSKQRYSEEELKKLAPDLLQIPLANGGILLVYAVQLDYDSQMGYVLNSYIDGFALLLPAGKAASATAM